MRAAFDADDYCAAPQGAYLVLPCALVFCARPSLWGFSVWGRPTAAELQRIVPLLMLELAPTAAPHASLIDAHRLESGDPRAFQVLAKHLHVNFGAFRTQVTRVALVRPPGVLGAMVAGFYEVQRAPYPVRVFDGLGVAAAWLRAGAVARDLDAVIDAASALPGVLLALRDWLEDNLSQPVLARAARALSRSSRSLQRDLAIAGSTFQREVDAARIRVAMRMLIERDALLTEIAYDVGCASPQHFSRVFRRVIGTSPSAWRDRQR